MTNAYSRRQVPVPSWVLAALRDHREAQDTLKAALGGGYDDQGLVFAVADGPRTGGPIPEQTVARAFDRLRRQGGLPGLRWYNVRHCSATMLLDAGVPRHAVSGLLGHASVRITADVSGARAKRNTDGGGAHIARLFGGLQEPQEPATPLLTLSA
jgi:integrase